jgi:uncharacterized C2H2 Zn-finger protein
VPKVPACGFCRRKFSSDVFLQKHYAELLKCPECENAFCARRSLFIHRNKEHNIDDDGVFVNCQVCGLAVRKSSIKYNLHKCQGQGIESDEVYECYHCKKKITDKVKLIEHVKSHATPQYKCEVCLRSFNILRYLSDHVRKQHPGKNYPCLTCGILLYTPETYANHIARHERQQQEHVCKICDNKIFKSASHLKDHNETCHPTSDYPYGCEYCDEKFRTLRKYNYHVKNDHFHKNVFTCHTCGKVYKNQTTFNVHLASHLDVKPHKCHLCDKSFAARYHLKDHILRHGDVKAFSCDFCEKSFKTRANLKLHRRRHVATKRHKCLICGYAVYQPNMLLNHMTSHSEERKFHCRPCQRSYKVRTHLLEHSKRHHGGVNVIINYELVVPPDGQMS